MSENKVVLELIEEVKRRKAEIAKLSRPNWKTNCSFTHPSLGTINIHTVKSLPKLCQILAALMMWEDYYTQACKELELDPKGCVWDGFTVSDWVDDVKTRVAKIQIESKKQKLQELEDRLDKIMSPELRAQLELEAIKQELA